MSYLQGSMSGVKPHRSLIRARNSQIDYKFESFDSAESCRKFLIRNRLAAIFGMFGRSAKSTSFGEFRRRVTARKVAAESKNRTEANYHSPQSHAQEHDQ